MGCLPACLHLLGQRALTAYHSVLGRSPSPPSRGISPPQNTNPTIPATNPRPLHTNHAANLSPN